MSDQGWERLLANVPRYGRSERFQIMAYSEMMPPPLIGWRPYGANHPIPRSQKNPFTWLVNEREQAFELGPGLQLIASEVLPTLERLDREQPARGVSRTRLEGNCYWPKDLAELPGAIPHERDVFQISPGISRQSVWLAFQAHLANMIWNSQADRWNRKPARRYRGRGHRSPDGKAIPDIARHPQLHGEVRIPRDMRSSLFNTDGQIFSDMGIPVVLFMENYDINRVGYHDTHDNMSNIDLDYGAAVAAIAIESVARIATEKRPNI